MFQGLKPLAESSHPFGISPTRTSTHQHRAYDSTLMPGLLGHSILIMTNRGLRLGKRCGVASLGLTGISKPPLPPFGRLGASPHQRPNASYGECSFARFSKRVYSLRKVRAISPVGPFRCLAMISSASPALLSFSSSSVA